MRMHTNTHEYAHTHKHTRDFSRSSVLPWELKMISHWTCLSRWRSELSQPGKAKLKWQGHTRHLSLLLSKTSSQSGVHCVPTPYTHQCLFREPCRWLNWVSPSQYREWGKNTNSWRGGECQQPWSFLHHPHCYDGFLLIVILTESRIPWELDLWTCVLVGFCCLNLIQT